MGTEIAAWMRRVLKLFLFGMPFGPILTVIRICYKLNCVLESDRDRCSWQFPPLLFLIPGSLLAAKESCPDLAHEGYELRLIILARCLL